MTKRIAISTIVGLIILLAMPGKIFAGIDKAKVDALFADWNKEKTPGVALAVIKDGAIVYQAGYGNASLEHNVPITPETRFHAASISKQFTAFAVMELFHRKKLSLEDDIREYLPEVPDFGKTITIRHLIHHTSGLRDQWEIMLFAGWTLDDVITQQQILKIIRMQKKLNFQPGEEFRYTNSGYTLLAELVARVSGQSFSQWTKENIFEQLGMSDSFFLDDHETVIKGLADSYKLDKKEGFKKTILNCSNVGPTGLITTAADLAKWVTNLKTGKVGGKGIIKQLMKPWFLNNGEKLDYAGGLRLSKYKGKKIIAHGGSMAGYRNFLVWFPEQDFAVVLLSNQSSVSPAHLAYQVAESYLGKHEPEPEPPAKTPPQKPSPVTLSIADITGTYQYGPGLTLSVSRDENRLMIQATGEEKYIMLPEKGNTYRVKEYNTNITFHKGDSEASPLLDIFGVRAKPIKPFRPSPKELEEYTGKYYSEELETVYTLVVEGNHLIARHHRFEDLILWPTVKDQFGNDIGPEFEIENWWFRSFDFLRHISGRIKGFHLSVPGSQNVYFKRTGQ